jgi:integrase
MHLWLGQVFPDSMPFHLKIVLMGIQRLAQHKPKRALPITPELLQEIHALLDLGNPLHATIWCLYIMSFFLMARKSNMVPNSKAGFRPSKQLCRRDVTVEDDCLLVNIKWSKTIQYGQRSYIVPLVAIPHDILCPVLAFRNMVKLVPGKSSGPTFLVRNSKGHMKPFTYKLYQSSIKALVALTGRNPVGYSSHSFRRGGASWAFRCGIRGELIQTHGDWKSLAYLKYLEFATDTRKLVSAKMAKGCK